MAKSRAPLPVRQKSPVGFQRLLRDCQFHDVEIFEAVARLGSVSSTARELDLNAPFISKSIKRLESAANLKFFVRSQTGLTLTPEGRRFLEFSQRLTSFVSSADWIEGETSDQEKQTLLTIAAASYLTSYVTAPVVSRIRQTHNHYRFRLVELGESGMMAQAPKGGIEMALHAAELNWPKTWVTEPIGSLTWILAARKGHPIGTTTSEVEVRRFPFVMPVFLLGSEFRYGEDRCPLTSAQRRSGDEAQTAQAGLELVRNSDQLIFVPEVIARARIASGELKRILVRDWQIVRETLWVSAHADQVPRKVFDQVITFGEKTIATTV